MNKTEAMAHMLAFAAPYGGFSVKESKRGRKFACTRCGEKIPPGKPDRRCKECRSKELAIIDESASMKEFSNPSEWARHITVHASKAPMPIDGKEPEDPFVITRQIKEASQHDSHKGTLIITEDTIICDICNQAGTDACNDCDYRGLKEEREAKK